MGPNSDLVRQMFDAFRTRDEDVGRNLVHPDFRFSPSTVDPPDGAFVGIDGLFEYLEAIEETWDDFRFSLGEVHENGDCVCALGRIYARGGGRVIDSPIGWVFQLHDGKASELRSYLSRAEALEAAGIEA